MGKKRLLLFLFIATEIVLYFSFLYFDLIGHTQVSMVLKYMSLLFCLLFSMDSLSTFDSRLVSVALVFAAVADLFLLVLNRWYALGVAFFCPVQILYALRLRYLGDKPFSLWIRVVLSGAALLVAGSLGYLDLLIALVCFYFPQLICNAVESFRCISTLRGCLFCIGLWLFLFCDICVGLNNLSSYISVSDSFLLGFAGIAMWSFYLPSQVLIVLSASGRVSPDER